MMNIRYCLMASAAVALSAVPISHAAHPEQISYNVLPKTESFLSAGALSEAMLMSSGKEQKLASICFITDTEDCQGRGFVSPGDYPDKQPNKPDWDVNNPEKCKKEGYVNPSCNSVQVPENFCPYDDNFYGKCECRSNLVTCSSPNIGVGTACDGKYDHCCNNACQSGYTTESGACRQSTSLVNACGNKCYKILSNTCTSGQISASPETGGYRNKIVSYTECGNPCFQSYNDNCQSSYVKTKESGKCYETSVLYTEYGTTCYKEKPCCDDTCPAYTSKTYKGALASTTGCGSKCYKCKCPSNTAPNFSGAAAGSAECGTCYKCSNTCSRGKTSVSCSWNYERVKVGTTECGGSCYECQYNYDCNAYGTSCSSPYKCNYNSCGICTSCSYNYDCDASNKSCPYGCASTNSCGKCTSCNSKPTPNYTFMCCDQSSYSGCNSGHPCWSGYSSCSSKISECQSEGGSASFQYCSYDLGDAYRHPATFRCQ